MGILEEFAALVARLRWQEAKTYKGPLAHEYTIFRWLPPAQRLRAKRIVHLAFLEHGYDGWFGDRPQVYLDAPDGYTYWMMVDPRDWSQVADEATVVLNREPTWKRDRRKRGWKYVFTARTRPPEEPKKPPPAPTQLRLWDG